MLMYVKYRALKMHPESFQFTPAIQTHEARKALPLSSPLPLEIPKYILSYTGSNVQDFTHVLQMPHLAEKAKISLLVCPITEHFKE